MNRRILLSVVLTVGCGSSGAAEGVDEPSESSAPLVVEGPAQPTPAAQVIPLSGTETERDWDILLDRIRWARAEGLATAPMGEAMARIGETFVGEPYTPQTLEVADPEALVVNLREFDCVTFVESSLAIARVVQGTNPDVTDPEALKARFMVELAGLRYRGGRINGYPSRLHYFSEWISDNHERGAVESISHLIGGSEVADRLDFMSAHASAYRQLSDPANLEAIRRIEARLSDRPRYPVHENRIVQFEDEIRTGDIIAAASTIAGLDVVHTGIALWKDGRLRLMHAPLIGEAVQISDESLAERITRIASQDGIFVARPVAVEEH